MSAEPHKVTRRTAILAGSGAVAMTLGVLSTPTAAASPGDGKHQGSLLGRVLKATADTLTILTQSGERKIELTGDTRAYSGVFGRVTSGHDFLSGDMVVAEGYERDGALVASAVGSLFRPLNVAVGSVTPDRSIAHTDHGDLALVGGQFPDESTEIRRKRQDIIKLVEPGAILAGSTWVNPKDNTRYLLIAP